MPTVAAWVQRTGGPPDACRLLVACSGGADSTALLAILRQLAEARGWLLGVAHIDHGQGPWSRQASEAVRARCRRWRIPFHLAHLDPAEHPPNTSEDALRRERYRLLERIAEEHGYAAIATGHTADDQAETVLMRLLRGSSKAGLAGIPPVRTATIYRPLLDLDRVALRAFLRSRRLTWLEDPSNQDHSKLRNRIRNHLLPAIRETINPAASQALRRLADWAAQDEEALMQWAAAVELTPEGGDQMTVDLDELLGQPRAIRARVIGSMVRGLLGPSAHLELAHQTRLLDRLESGRPFRLGLQAGLEARARSGRLALRRVRPDRPVSVEFHIEIPGIGTWPLPGSEVRIRVQAQNTFRPDQVRANRAYFDGVAAPFPLEVRSLLPGDRFLPWGSDRSCKVARLLLKEKVPRPARSSIPLLVSGDRILWVIGHRRSRLAPIPANCRKILRVEWLDGGGPRP